MDEDDFFGDLISAKPAANKQTNLRTTATPPSRQEFSEDPDTDFFADLIKPSSSTPAKDTFFQDLEGKDNGDDAFFDEAVKANQPNDLTQKAVSAFLDMARGGVVGASSNKDIQDIPEAIHGKIDPVQFTARDIKSDPFSTMAGIQKIQQREESALAEPVLRIMRGEDVGSIMKSGLDALTGKTQSEYTEGLSSLGDIGREFGLPEPVAAALGLITSAALPGSVALDKVAKINRLFTKTPNLTKNVVAKDSIIQAFKDSRVGLDDLKNTLIKEIDASEFPERTMQDFKAQVLVSKDRKSTASIFRRFKEAEEETLSYKDKTAQAEKPVSKVKDLMHDVKRTYQRTVGIARAMDQLDGFKEYKGTNARVSKGLAEAETNALYNIDVKKTELLEEWQKLGIGSLTDEQRKVLSMHAALKTGDENAYEAVRRLMSAEGMKTLRPLTINEQEIIKSVSKRTNDPNLIKQIIPVYERVTGRKFQKFPDYVTALKYQGDQGSLVDEIGRNQKYRPNKNNSLSFTEREANSKLMRWDFENLVMETMHDQEWYANVMKKVVDAEDVLQHPSYVKHMGESYENAKDLWNEYLSAIKNRGANSVSRPGDQILRTARSNLNHAVLGYKLSSIMMQPMAVIDAVSYASTRYGARAAKEILAEVGKSWINPKHAQKIIMGSKALRVRQGGELAIKESLEQAEKIGSKNAYQKFMKGSLSLMREADVRTAAGVQEAFKKILARHGVKNVDREADYLMNLVSGNSEVTQRPLILSQGEGAKLLFTFQTFFLNRWSLMMHDMILKGTFSSSYKQKMKSLVGMMILASGAVAEDEARKRLYELTTGKEMDQAERSFLSTLSQTTIENIPLFGGMVTAARQGGDNAPPVVRVLENLIRGSKQMVAGKTDYSKGKGARKAAEGVATLAGIPGTAQIFDLIERAFPEPDQKVKIPLSRLQKQKNAIRRSAGV